jgi:hypothetical protein
VTEKGTYIACSNNGTSVSIDEYSVVSSSTGYTINSDNVVFGNNGFQQKAELRTDSKWVMQELNVRIDTLDIEMKANIQDGNLHIAYNQANGKYEKTFFFDNARFFFMYNGALVVPLIWLRGFDFDNYETVIYQMLPVGLAEVKQIRTTDLEHNIRRFSILMQIQGYADIVNVQTDMFGKVLYYQSQSNGLTVKIQI